MTDEAVPADETAPADPATTGAGQGTVKPSLRERLRPLELLGISLVLAIFAGFVTGLTIRPWASDDVDPLHDWIVVFVVFGVSFVIALVVLAMLALGGYDPPKEAPLNVLVRPQDKLPRSGWKDQQGKSGPPDQ